MLRDDGEAWAGSDSGGIYYLDPGNPDAVRHTVNVYVNVLRNYDVDGIHLDQVRYYEGQPLRWGYNPTSVARFNLRYAPRPEHAARSERPRMGRLAARAGHRAGTPHLSRGARRQAECGGHGGRRHLGQGAAELPATGSASPRTRRCFRTGAAGCSEGIVDYALPMDYYREIEEHADWFDAWTRFASRNTGQARRRARAGRVSESEPRARSRSSTVRGRLARSAWRCTATPCLRAISSMRVRRIERPSRPSCGRCSHAPRRSQPGVDEPDGAWRRPGRSRRSGGRRRRPRRQRWPAPNLAHRWHGRSRSAEIPPGAYTLSIQDADAVSVFVNMGVTSVVRFAEVARN